MVRALLFLRTHSLVNAVRVQLRKLRQPKALLGFAFLATYFWFFFFRRGNGSIATLWAPGAPQASLIPMLIPLIPTALLAFAWIAPGDEPAIPFKESEILFLFTAPWRRRALIVYKIAASLFGSFFSAFFFALLFTGRLLFSPRGLLILFAWVVLVGAIALHRMASSLTLHRLSRAGVAKPMRRRLLAAAGIAVVAVAILQLRSHLPELAAAQDPATWVRQVIGLWPLSWLLVPARILLFPFSAAPLAALGTGVAIIGILAAWILVLECPFEEASVNAAGRAAARLATMQRTGRFSFTSRPKQGRREPFPLARARTPELAFLWKNLIASGKLWLSPRTWALTAAALVALVAVLSHLMGNTYWKAGGAIATLGTITMWYGLIQGPLITRLDLRQDLGNLDILRTYPLPGWRIMAGELLAPTAVLTGIVWLGILAWYLGLHGHQPPALSMVWFSPPMRIVIAGAAAFATPFVLLAEFIIPNLAATLFPSLFRMLPGRARGLDQAGHRMLFGFGQFAGLILILAGPALLGWLATYLTHFLLGAGPALITGTVLGVVLLSAEIVLGIWFLGLRFDKLTPLSE